MFWITIPHALACGGMFCDPGPVQSQVVQNAERIAFAIDEEAGTVEAHVQIFYEGPPDEFAWIVPVASEPEVFISNDALFATLQNSLAPTFQLDRQTLGTCRGEGNRVGLGCGKAEFAVFEAGSLNDTGAPTAVTVVSEAQVGPYDTTILQANDEGALVGWLQDNGYAVPDGLEPLLAPYLSSSGHFLAVKLQKDNDAGDIAPLGWRYQGDQPAVPIQLTALAAAPDLGLEVSVFANHRVVPKSYLHVVLNEANFDWFNGGQNYYEQVGRAADQAGGHAFVTDYSGPTDLLAGLLWTPTQDGALGRLRIADTSTEWIEAFLDLRAPLNANTAVALSEHLDLEGRDPLDWAMFPDETALAEVDLGALTDAIEFYVAEPLRRANGLLDYPTVTRLSSSLDADEMTVDPVFVQNPDMGEVSNLHTATLVTDCTGKKSRNVAPRMLELSDGRVYQLPPTSEIEIDDSTFWTAKHSDIEALRIEETAEAGPPTILSDLTAEAVALTDGPIQACGCSGNALRGSGAFVIFLGALLVRRRNR